NGLSAGGEAAENRPELLNHELHQPSRTRAQNADRVHNSGGTKVPGNFVYSPPAGTLLPVGVHILSTTFTPTATTDYAAARDFVQLTVNKGTPVCTWATPAAIVYPTPLSATQLDASCSVPGTFVYSPPSGTVLAVGAHTLSVIFTPTDTNDYTTVMDSVELMVKNSSPILTSMSPTSATVGAAGFTLTVNGSNFVSSSTVNWNGVALTTTY